MSPCTVYCVKEDRGNWTPVAWPYKLIIKQETEIPSISRAVEFCILEGWGGGGVTVGWLGRTAYEFAQRENDAAETVATSNPSLGALPVLCHL
jgi:hypothetical protein